MTGESCVALTFMDGLVLGLIIASMTATLVWLAYIIGRGEYEMADTQ